MTLVEEVCRAEGGCINLNTDEDVQDALCNAAEEVGQIVLPDLNLGCGPGYTPPNPPPPGACEGNLVPVIDSVKSNDIPVVENSTVNLVLGESYDVVVAAHDQDTKLGTLYYYATIDGVETAANTTGQVTLTPTLPGTYEVYLFVNDGCVDTSWGPVNIEVNCCPFDDPGLIINLAQTARIELNKNRGTTTANPTYVTECMNECVTISSITINLDGLDDIVITDFENDTLLDWVIPDGIDFTMTTNGASVCLEDGASIASPYTINVSYTDSCDNRAEASLVVTFEDCSLCADNIGPSISIDDKIINAGDSLSYTPGDSGYTASDDDTNGEPSYALSNGPAGMSIDSATGEITWTTACGDEGTYSDILVTITDACGLSASDTFDLTVECINNAPVIGNLPPATVQKVNILQTYTYDVNATDSDGDNLTYTLTASPNGMTINPSTGEITWTWANCSGCAPKSGGKSEVNRCHKLCDIDVTVRVTDNSCCGPLFDEESFIVEVW